MQNKLYNKYKITKYIIIVINNKNNKIINLMFKQIKILIKINNCK